MSAPRDAIVDCPHAARCGGCPSIELAYGAQLSTKRARVVAAFSARNELSNVVVEEVEAALPIVRYRTRSKLVVAAAGDVEAGVAIGLYDKSGGHRVVDVPECQVMSPAIAEVVAALRVVVEAEPVVAALLRGVDVRELVDERTTTLLTLLADRDDVRSPATLARFRAVAGALRGRLPSLVGVAISLRDRDSKQLLGTETLLLEGHDTAIDRIDRVAHLATFGAFVQAHRGQAAQLHRHLIDGLAIRTKASPSARVLELYGGSGAIGLSLAAAGAAVTSVESFAPAAKLAKEGARLLPPDAGTFDVMPGDAASVLARLVRADRRVAAMQYDAIVVDPPRRGLAPDVRRAIAALRAGAIAYVSCDPDTLARDLAHLAHLGYAPDRVSPLDMIPLSDEVECVAILRPSAPAAIRIVHDDRSLIVVDKPPHLAMTPGDEHSMSILERLRDQLGAPDVTPLQPLDVGSSGLALFTRTPADVVPWSKALADATAKVTYVALVRGLVDAPSAKGRDLEATTSVRPLERVGAHTLIAATVRQGSAQSVRRHLAATGHAIVGDSRHGPTPTNRHFEEKQALDRTFFHCARIELRSATDAKRLRLSAALAPDLMTTLARTAGRAIDVDALLDRDDATARR